LFDKLFISPALNGLVIFFLLLLLAVFILRQRYELLTAQQAEIATDIIRNAKKGLQHVLNQSQTATTAISLSIDENGRVENFDKIASLIYETSDDIDVLELLPGGVIEYIYPMTGNESVMHYDVLHDSARNREAILAKNAKELYFAGPLELKQGGLGIVGRLPVYRQNKFWGFAAVVIRFDNLIRAAGIDTSGTNGYYYEFSKVDPVTKKEVSFFPEEKESVSHNAVFSDYIPEGDWKISLIPADPYTVLKGMQPMIIISLLLSLTGGLLITQVTKRPLTLQKIVTERTEELDKSEKRNKAIVNAIPDLMLVTDKEGRFIDYINPHNEPTMMPPAEFLGKSISEIMPAPLSGEINRNIREVIRTKKILSHSYDLMLRGENRYYEARYVASGSNEVFIIIRDITENKKVQLALEESERELREIFNSSFQFTGLLNPEGVLLEANQTALEYSGYTEEEVVGRHFWEIAFWDNEEEGMKQVEWLKEAIKKAASGQSIREETRVIFKEGVVDIFDFSIKPVKNREGRIIYLIAEGRLITELANAERELKLAHEQLRMHLSNSPLGVIEYTRNHVVKQWSKKSEEIFGWTEQDMLNRDIRTFNMIHKEDLENNLVSAEELMQGEESGNISYVRNFTKDGRLLHCVWYNSVIKDDKGKVVTVMSLVQDITREQETEEALRQSEQKLRQVLSSTTDNYYVIDRNFTIILINEAAEKNLKRAWNKTVTAGVKLTEVIPADTREPILKSLEKVFQGELVEYELRSPVQGLPDWLLINYSPVRDAAGNITAATIIAKDISEKKKAEQLLRESEEKYRSFFEKASDAIFVFDRFGRFLEVNNGLAVLLGYTAYELKSMSLPDILFDEGMELNPDHPDSLISRKPVIRKLILKTKEGAEVIAEINSTQLPGGNHLALVRNLTDRIKAQQQLETEKELSDYIINSLPGIFYLYDDTAKILRWNTRFEEVSGYSGEELSRLSPYDLFEGKDQELIRKKIREVFEKGISDAEAFFKTKSGELIPYYFTGASIMNGETPCLLGMGVDITERKKAESALIESETKYRLLFANTPLPMWVYDTVSLKILDVNEAAVSHYGYTKTEFLSLFLPDLYPDERKESQDILSGNTPGESRHLKKDRQPIDVEISSHELIFDNRNARLIVAVDITDKLRYEREIRNTTDQLRQLTHHLQNVREEERKHIAREIHDELGQQLTVLKMDISLLDRKINTTDNVVLTRIKNLLQMIDTTVKTVRKISSELRPSMLDDLGLIAAMEWHAQEFEKRFGIRTVFSTEIHELDLPLEHLNGLFRIYQESLTNIARHSRAKLVKTVIRQKGDDFEISITDNGEGFIISGIENKKTLGILGMKERASMLGAAFSITSTPGEGTTVLVRIPVSHQIIKSGLNL